MHESLVRTIQTIDKISDHALFLNGIAGLMRNGYWGGLKDENRLQLIVAMYINTVYPNAVWMHPENEGKRTNWEQFMIKYNGVCAGMPDIMIFQPKIEEGKKTLDVICGCAIELKIGSNKPTDAQYEMLDKLVAKGWIVAVCNTFEETKKFIDSFFKDIEL